MNFRPVPSADVGYELVGEHSPKLVEDWTAPKYPTDLGVIDVPNLQEVSLGEMEVSEQWKQEQYETLDSWDAKRAIRRREQAFETARVNNRVVRYLKELNDYFRGAYLFYGKAAKAIKIHVYRKQDLYAMGWVGYGDWTVSDTGVRKFTVYSRRIKNNKCASNKMQYHVARYSTVKLAVKRASATIVPYTEVENVAQNVRAASRKVDGISTNAESALSSRRDSLTRNLYRDNSALHQELYRLLDIGHKFMSVEVEHDIKNLRAAQKEAEELRQKKYNMYCVRVFQDRHGVQTYSVIRIDNISPNFHRMSIHESVDEYQRPIVFTNDTLDDELQGSLAVLSMVDIGDHVEGVGYRDSEDMYFAYCKGDT